MTGHECYHCKQWIEEGVFHDCWTTTEGALTRELSEELRDAWERLRETAAAFGEQRIYASHRSIMFSRKSCYFFVRPKRDYLEVCVFLGRTLKAPQVRRVDPASKSKVVHVIHIRHRDEVETPITDWLQEAYHLPDTTAAMAGKVGTTRAAAKPAARATKPALRAAKATSAAKAKGEATKTTAKKARPKKPEPKKPASKVTKAKTATATKATSRRKTIKLSGGAQGRRSTARSSTRSSR